MNRSNHNKTLNYQTLIFWIIVFVSLFLFFQLKYSYFFYYIEQLQLFLFTGQFAKDIILEPGGLALYISLFCVQFYIYPGVGAFITACVLTGIGLLMQANLKRLASVDLTCLLSVLPIVALLSLHVDMNYKIQGTIGLLFMLGGLYLFSGITDVFRRLAAGIILIPVLFLLAGPVAFLFAWIALLWEIVKGNRKSYLFLLLPLEMLLIAYMGMRMGWHGEYRMFLFPDFYYEHILKERNLYYVWFVIGGCMIIVRLLGYKKEFSKKIAVVLYISQILIFLSPLYLLGLKDNRMILTTMEMDHYMRYEEWDKVIEVFPRERNSKFMMNMLNLALAKKGQLGDKLFEYRQNGPQTIIADWDSTFPNAIILSDIYYHIGDIGAAQKLAFEGCIGSLFGGNVRMIQRLVETNLIYGAYPVAEKYISLLEKTYAYKNWAKEQRKYLYNEQDFSENNVLSKKRKSLVKDDRYVVSGDITAVLEQLSVNNPSNTLAMQYLLALYLTNKDLKNFKRLFEIYAKTEIWPSLAQSHQEAIIALDQKNPFYWIQSGVTTKVEQKFRAFDNDMNFSRTQYNFAEKMLVNHGTTFWYYLLYKKIS